MMIVEMKVGVPLAIKLMAHLETSLHLIQYQELRDSIGNNMMHFQIFPQDLFANSITDFSHVRWLIDGGGPY